MLYGGFSFGENMRGGVAAEWVYGVKEAQGVSWVKVPKGGPHPAVPVALSRGMGNVFSSTFFFYQVGNTEEIFRWFFLLF